VNPPSNSDDQHLLRVATVAHLLNISEAAILQLAERGDLDLAQSAEGPCVMATSLRGYITRRNRKSTRQATKARGNDEGSVYEAPRGSGIWYAALTVREGRKSRRVKRRAPSQKLALQKLEALKEAYRGDAFGELAAPPAAPQLPPRPIITYRELLAEWIASVGVSVKASTRRHYTTAAESWLNPFIGDRQVVDGDYQHLQRVFTEQLVPLYSPSTVHRAASVLKQALEYAVDPCGYIARNPAAKLRLPRERALSPSIALTIGELQSILRIARTHRYGPLILFGALTGARLSECPGVQEGDLDHEHETIHIQRQLSAVKGRGLAAESLKTPSSDRLLPRTPRLMQYLERYIAERRISLRHLGYKEVEGGWIFLNTKGGLVHPRLIEEAFDLIVERAGLSAKYPAAERAARAPQEKVGGPSTYQPKTCAVSFHDLRHTLLTHLGDLDIDETTRGRIAGHGPRNVTQRYDRSTIRRMRAALVAFEELVFNGLDREGDEAR